MTGHFSIGLPRRNSERGAFARHDFSQIQISNSHTIRQTQLRDLAAHPREFYPERHAF